MPVFFKKIDNLKVNLNFILKYERLLIDKHLI